MRIERDFRRMEYKVIISRDELRWSFETMKRFDNLITEISKTLWKERLSYYENLSRKRLS